MDMNLLFPLLLVYTSMCPIICNAICKVASPFVKELATLLIDGLAYSE